MTPITVLMHRLSRKPLHERIALLRIYVSFEKPESIRWKELQHALKFELIKQLSKENRLVQRESGGSRSPRSQSSAEQVA